MGSPAGALEYICPVCDGDGDGPCLCDRQGVVDATEAEAWAAEGEQLRRLPAPPARLDAPCHDCAFHKDSPEVDSGELYRIAEQSTPFYCHVGMHHTADGRYIPRQQDRAGKPIGHPVCAGWLRAQRGPR